MGCYFISIGGSGAKILESLIHLTAAGILPGNEDLNVIALDPDTGNGNLGRTKSTLGFFQNFQDVQVGSATLLKNKINKLNPFPYDPIPAVGANLDHGNLMNEPIIKEDPLGQLYKVLYSQKERQTSLNEGFRGHPSIGAAVLARTVPTSVLWQNLNAKISPEIGAGHSVKVFIAGSIFGGTGAAGIPTIARLLRNTFNNKISIGGVFMLPYFSFTDAGNIDGELYAKSENFLTNSKAALKYYAQEQNYFNYMYFLGDNDIVESNFSIGGQTQRNNAHIIDLYGALAAIDFFANATVPATEVPNPVQYNYICRGDSKTFDWNDFQNLAPNFKQCFMQFARFIFAYIQFIKPTLDTQPIVESNWWGVSVKGSNPPWYLPLAYNEDCDINLLTPDNNKIANFNNYIINYCIWLQQLETLPQGRTVSLINPNVFKVKDNQISINAEHFKRCDPTQKLGGLDLGNISKKISNVDDSVAHQGFGKLLLHVYNSCK